jgi:AcrR family transcriptional regulator
VRTGALTHHYDSKQLLIEDALKQLATETLDRTSAVQVRSTDDLIELVSSALPTSDEGQIEWKVWLVFWSECARGNEVIQKLNRDFQERWLTVLRNALAAIDHRNSNDTADILAAAINGIGIDATVDPSSWPPQRVQSTARRLVDRLIDC